MQKHFILACYLFLISLSGFAQTRWGLRGGLNFADAALKVGGLTSYDNTKMRVAPHLGGFAQFQVSSQFAVQVNALLSSKGYREKIDDNVLRSRPLYLEVPVYGMFQIPYKSIAIFLAGGGYLAYGFTGKTALDKADLSTGSAKKSTPIAWGFDKDDNDLIPLDAGLNVGMGIQTDLFQLGIYYSYGLVNCFADGDADNIWRNRVLSVSVGYFLTEPPRSRRR
jgi:hypothetical protein